MMDIDPHHGKTQGAKASYLYGWNDLDPQTLYSIGVIARRAPDGTPRFNFSQLVWLAPDVAMDWSITTVRALETLAVNILTYFLPDPEPFLAPRPPDDRALSGATAFARTFLWEMPRNGGCIPSEEIQKWIVEEL